MPGPRIQITEKTTVPLFAVIAALFASVSAVGGHFMWVAAISTRSEIAHAKNSEQDGRLDRMSVFTQTQLAEQSRLLKEVSERTSRTETMVEIIYKEKHR